MKYACKFNEKDYEDSESRRQTLKNIMEALSDPSIYMIGVCGKDNDNHSITYGKNGLTSLLERVIRRCLRDKLFDDIVEVSIGENPDLRRIQHKIAHEIGWTFEEQEEKQDKGVACCGSHYFQFHSIDNNITTVTENAQQLFDEIKTVSKILFILRDLRSRLDLAKVGIPFGVEHQGLKLILTSESEDILSNQMNTQCTFKFSSLP